MKQKVIIVLVFFQILVATITLAHPGSGIVADQSGQIFFTDTGKGVWKIDLAGKLVFIPASKFHWMTMDRNGAFASSPRSFGGYFERVVNEDASLVMCSDFPLVAAADGSIYYVNTRPAVHKIIKRTAAGSETTICSHPVFEHVSDIAMGPEGSLYITEASAANKNTIRRVDMDGKVSVVATYVGKKAVDLPLETVPSYCRGLAVDPSGNVFVAATGSRAVLKISPQGKIRTILSEPCPWTPTGIAVNRGSVYILEWHDVTEENLEVRAAYIPRVRKISPDGKVTTIATVSRSGGIGY